MMSTIVVLQPQYLPWRGVFEQVALADVYVHFDDVQFPQGRSFSSRVQVKTADGSRWLTVPVRREGPRPIAETRIDDSRPWRAEHLRTLAHAYARAPHRAAMLLLAEDLLADPSPCIGDLTSHAIERVAETLGLRTRFARSSSSPSSAKATDRLVELCREYGASRYVTGHGALAYLDEAAFAVAGIAVEVMDYDLRPYPQLHGDFDPYVSVLDLIANVGITTASTELHPRTVPWAQARAALSERA
jgi:WbqC-like protein